MLYPHDIEQKLGFDKIRDWLKKNCSGQQGENNVGKIRFTSNKSLIGKLCAQTAEYMSMINAGENIPALNYPEVDLLLKKAKVQGAFLETEEVADVHRTLKALMEWYGFLHDKQEEYVEISMLAQKLEIDKSLVKRIESCIDEKGEIRDSASPELRKIRSEIHHNEVIARKTLDRVMRETSKADMTPEDSSLTVRNGRLVIPIKSEHKRSLKGFIHDASASGSIIFIEPAEVLEINNDLKELGYKEKREIIRILMTLTDEIRLHIESISFGHRFWGLSI